jgi:hypothetical protein
MDHILLVAATIPADRPAFFSDPRLLPLPLQHKQGKPSGGSPSNESWPWGNQTSQRFWKKVFPLVQSRKEDRRLGT